MKCTQPRRLSGTSCCAVLEKLWQLINVFCSCEGSVTDFDIEPQVFIDVQPSAEIKGLKRNNR